MINEPEVQTIRKHLRKGITQGTLWLGAALLFLGVISQWVWPEFLTLEVDTIQWDLLLIGWCFMVGTMVFLGFRWRVLLPDTTASRTFFTACLSSGLLINYALPGPMGELTGAWLLKREDETPMSEGLTTTAVARLLGLFTAAIGAILLWPFIEIDVDFAPLIFQGLIIGIGIGASILAALYLSADHFARWTERKPEGHQLRTIGQAFVKIRHCSRNRFGWGILYSIIGHTVAFLGVWISLQALGGSPSAIDIGFTYLVGTCCGTIAFLFPGSQLTWDAIFIGVLTSAAGYELGSATVAVAVLRIEQLAMMLFGALPLFWILWRQESRSNDPI